MKSMRRQSILNLELSSRKFEILQGHHFLEHLKEIQFSKTESVEQARIATKSKRERLVNKPIDHEKKENLQ